MEEMKRSMVFLTPKPERFPVRDEPVAVRSQGRFDDGIEERVAPDGPYLDPSELTPLQLALKQQTEGGQP